MRPDSGAWQGSSPCQGRAAWRADALPAKLPRGKALRTPGSGRPEMQPSASIRVLHEEGWQGRGGSRTSALYSDSRPRATRAGRPGPGQSASPVWQDRGLVTSGPRRRLCAFGLILSGWAQMSRPGRATRVARGRESQGGKPRDPASPVHVNMNVHVQKAASLAPANSATLPTLPACDFPASRPEFGARLGRTVVHLNYPKGT